MLRGKLLGLALMVTTFLGVTIWSVWNYDRAFNAVTRYTQLSAWSLAQLELELHNFRSSLALYRAGAISQKELNLRFDIAWSRLDTFLHGEETLSVRAQHGAGEAISTIFSLLQRYELAVTTGASDSLALAEFAGELDLHLPEVRDVMIRNFTGASAISQREILDDARSQNGFILGALLLAIMGMLFALYREIRRHNFLTWHDNLTRLPNRDALVLHLRRCMRRSRCGGVTVCLIDLGHFREVNDSLGYEVGDRLLRNMAKRIRLLGGPACYVARTGSDEFAIVISGAMPLYLCFPFLTQMHTQLQQMVFDADPAHRVQVFMGASQYARVGDTAEELLLFADIALSRAKAQKMPYHALFSEEMYLRYQHNRTLSAELQRLVLEDDSEALSLYYQPIVQCQDPDRLGAEALLRWQHPRYGAINPLDVVALAEENGLGDKLGRWILRRLQRDLASWPALLLARIELSVNLSASMFHELLPGTLTAEMAGSPIALHQIILELTETIVLDDLAMSQRIVEALHRVGVRVALDDFGTGWSSLSYLRELHFDKLKIDRSFITRLDTDPRQALFVEMIIDLSHRLGVAVVAEGVETAAERKVVLQMGADEIQGYFYAKALPAANFRRFCEGWMEANSAQNDPVHDICSGLGYSPAPRL